MSETATTPDAAGDVRSALFLPLFDGLADPAVVARLSAEVEAAGWHGVFVWDHVRWREPVAEVADQLAEVVADVTALRREVGMVITAPYDVAVTVPPGTDPTPDVVAGATWWMVEFRWDDVSVDQVRGVVRDGPAAPSRRQRSSSAQET